MIELETTDPAMRREMTITMALADADHGTDIIAVHGGLPSGVPTADNEANWRLIHKTCSARRVLEKPQGA